MRVTVYTDGACSNNGKVNAVAGWGYVIQLLKQEKETFTDSGIVKPATNQRAELLAVIKAIKKLSSIFSSFVGIDIDIYTDSAYLYNCYKNKWWEKWEKNNWQTSNKKSVKNKDLWLQLIPIFKDENIKIYKIKGHSGNTGNEIADFLAKEAIVDSK